MPIRVFLSSKMGEFKHERAAIAQQIAAVHGFQVNAAEQWGSRNNRPEKLYRDGVRECHIYLGLFGHAYSLSTHEEYQAACENPYRQKLIYLKESRSIDSKLAELIEAFELRHRPYTFRDLWDLLPRVQRDLDWAVEEILNQHLELYTAQPVAQGEEDASAAVEAWENKQLYLTALFRRDTDLTTENLRAMRRSLQENSHNPRGGLVRALSRFIRS